MAAGLSRPPARWPGRPATTGYLLKRLVGRPPIKVRRYHASFSYRAQNWKMPRRVVAKVEWHPRELHPRVGFVVTNQSCPAERAVVFCNRCGTAAWCQRFSGASLLPQNRFCSPTDTTVSSTEFVGISEN